MKSLAWKGVVWCGAVQCSAVQCSAVQASLVAVTDNPLVLSDNVTGLMWTQDANLARTNRFGIQESDGSFGAFGVTSEGTMNWATANAWVRAMNAANYGGYNDWRLPTVSPQNGTSFNYSWSDTGSSDRGANVSGQGSELGYMYYENLRARSYADTSGNTIYRYGIKYVGGFDGTGYDVGIVENVESYYYWTGTTYAPYPISAWYFDFAEGQQSTFNLPLVLNVWAVRSGGNVAAAEVEVGEPGGVTLAFLGFGLVALRQRRWGLGAS